MARIYYRCEPFSKADVTLALESGVDGVSAPRPGGEGGRPFPLHRLGLRGWCRPASH